MGEQQCITVGAVWRHRWPSDYTHPHGNQWPMGSPCLPIGLSKTKPCQFSYVALYASLSYIRYVRCVAYIACVALDHRNHAWCLATRFENS